MSDQSGAISDAAKAFWTSLVRTVVPLIVGAVIAWLVKLGIPVDDDLSSTLATLLTLVFTAVYYALVRLLETYVTPKFGWLLGFARKVEYTKAA